MNTTENLAFYRGHLKSVGHYWQFEIDIDKLKDLPAALSSKQKRSGYRIDLIGTCSMNNLMRFLLNH
jgi:hypothetical protein